MAYSGPVSYTHLDVYKRQALDDGQRRFQLVGQLNDLFPLPLLHGPLLLPVSYTHLSCANRWKPGISSRSGAT